MIYKFKCKVAGDLIMLGATGDALLRAIGREPAAQGIIEPAAMAAAMAGIQQAVAADEAARAEAGQAADGDGDDDGERQRAGDGVALRQRLWPMHEMLQRAAAAGEPIVWGV